MSSLRSASPPATCGRTYLAAFVVAILLAVVVAAVVGRTAGHVGLAALLAGRRRDHRLDLRDLRRSGLVVTYTTSGIFNFAQGAIGMFWPSSTGS